MVKRYLLSALFVAALQGLASAQCTPDPLYADSTFGVWPDTTANLPCAFADDAAGYNTAINIKTLTDTSVSVTIGTTFNVTAYIEAFRVNNVTGLPAGFSYIPNASTWTNEGSAPAYTSVQGCLSLLAAQPALQAVIASNPDGADFPLVVTVDAKVNTTDNTLANFVLAGKWLSEVTGVPGVQAIDVTGYVLKVRPSSSAGCLPVGTIEVETSSFDVQGNYPNPFTNATEIRYSASSRHDVNFEVRNMVGKVVMDKTVKAERGQNTINLSADQFVPGIYFYTITDGAKAVTRKMIVSAR